MTKKILGLCAFLAATAHAQTLTSTAIQRYFTPVRTNLEAAAEAMPADKFDYKLTPGQMTFAEWLLHSADRNYLDCAALKGEPRPVPADVVNSQKGKAAVSKVLHDSFAYCAAALGAMTDAKVTATPEMSYSFLHTVVHNNEIYGNLAGYLRSAGVVPPSTARRLAAAPKQ